MPGRVLPLVTGEIYHVFNRGIDRRPTFIAKKEYERALQSIKFYRFAQPPIRLSRFLLLDKKRQELVLDALENSFRLVDIICFCLMPNHFHFLLKQKKDNGISKFLSNFQNSYTRFFNTKNQRDGPLFLNQFKAIRIETDEQLVHVSRYIHLNPYTGYIIKTLEEIKLFPYSSLASYLEDSNDFIQTELIQSFFNKPIDYQEFVFNQADYQRRLKEIEHLLLE